MDTRGGDDVTRRRPHGVMGAPCEGNLGTPAPFEGPIDEQHERCVGSEKRRDEQAALVRRPEVSSTPVTKTCTCSKVGRVKTMAKAASRAARLSGTGSMSTSLAQRRQVTGRALFSPHQGDAGMRDNEDHILPMRGEVPEPRSVSGYS